MERYIDNLLDSIFGGVSQINLVGGILLAILGIVLLLSNREHTRGRQIAGWICLVLGFLGVLSGTAQYLLR